MFLAAALCLARTQMSSRPGLPTGLASELAKGYQRHMPSFRFAIPVVLLLATQARSELRVPAPVVNLGEVKAGLPLTHTFELINDGPGIVEILDTRGSCGCVVGKVEPRVIQPGERGTLTLRMHTLGQAAGPHLWKATVGYRQGGMEKDITVGVQVRLVTEVTVQPATLTVITDGDLIQLVTLTDQRAKPLQVHGVQTSTPGLKARLLDQKTGTARIELETRKDLSPGRHDEMLTIDTDDPGYRQLQVPVTIIKTSQTVVAVPSRVEMQGGTTSCLVRLRSGSEKAIAIGKIESVHPALTCRWAPGPDTQATVRIEADPRQLAGRELETTITIHLTSPTPETLSIPVVVRP